MPMRKINPKLFTKNLIYNGPMPYSAVPTVMLVPNAFGNFAQWYAAGGGRLPAAPQPSGALVTVTEVAPALVGIGGVVVAVGFGVCSITTGTLISFTPTDIFGNTWGPSGYPAWSSGATQLSSPQCIYLPPGYAGNTEISLPITWQNLQGWSFRNVGGNEYPCISPPFVFDSNEGTIANLAIALLLGASDVVNVNYISVNADLLAAMEMTPV
jgi:hypothetical protein